MDQAHYDDLISSENLTLVFVTAKWCRGCNALKPTLKRIVNKYKGPNIQFLDVDFDHNGDITKKAMDGVTKLPFIMLKKDGEKIFDGTGKKCIEPLQKVLDGYLGDSLH